MPLPFLLIPLIGGLLGWGVGEVLEDKQRARAAREREERERAERRRREEEKRWQERKQQEQDEERKRAAVSSVERHLSALLLSHTGEWEQVVSNGSSAKSRIISSPPEAERVITPETVRQLISMTQASANNGGIALGQLNQLVPGIEEGVAVRGRRQEIHTLEKELQELAGLIQEVSRCAE